MAKDPFDSALAGFQRWTATTKRKLSADPVGEMEMLLELMRDYLDIGGPADLDEGDLNELLLRIYPSKVTVFDPAGFETTIPALRDFLAYLVERGEMPEGTASALERELDLIAPRFTDVMETGVMEEDDEDDYEPVDLKEAFGLPDQLPPVRLPAVRDLAAMARHAPTMAQLHGLAWWVGAGRAVTEDGELSDGDAVEAADQLGLGPSRLEYLWPLALDTGFVELDEDETHAVPGEIAQAWDNGDDDEVHDIWQMVLAIVLDTTLDVAATLDPDLPDDLDLTGHGAALAVMLFLARPDGLPVAEVSEVIKSVATDELPPAQAEGAWQSWIAAHGDPARLLLDQMAELGAIQITTDAEDGPLARLTPLGLAAIRTQVVESGVEVPLLPPPEQMTATDLIAMAGGASEEEFTAETAAWLAHRTAESAARELLAVAAESDPASRLLAVGVVVTELGASAEPAWRDALGRIELRCYGKAALATLADGDTDTAASGVEPTDDDVAWMITDALAAEGWNDVSDEAGHEPAALVKRLGDAIPAGQELAAFEMMARVPHPDAANVLTVIGKHHPDKKIAKLARKSAYKAASRQAAARR